MKFPDFKDDFEKCKLFLKTFRSSDGLPKYLDLLQHVANGLVRSVIISLDDLSCEVDDPDFVGRVKTNTRRYLGLFAEAVDVLMPDSSEVLDAHNVYCLRHRRDAATEAIDRLDPSHKCPSEMKRCYEVRIRAMDTDKPFTLREVRACHIGQLVKVRGIITRCTDVKPLLQVAVYTCEECGYEIYQEVTARSFMPLVDCPSARCRTNNVKGILSLQVRASKFMKFQEAKIQELAEQVPKGHIPRSITLHVSGELTRQVGPGDTVEVSGIFLPFPYSGFRAMRAGLVADTFIEAMSITQLKKRYEEYRITDEESVIQQLSEDGDIYTRLASSIAPEIFGHEDVKKALLLVLVGSPTRQLKDGMKIRGDIHVCLMGDPGVAKSQLLKHMVTLAPRGVYTTGRGSSGVGLTAAVHRDSVTNEMVLEGGALVLADMGLCAIDEFDKMEEADRTAIHEVMEQQTVSIAKAGITTSLNARTAVLAAANPAWGRYDMRRTPAQNINLPPALLSRFDLMWLILDRADLDTDLGMARHVLYVHQHCAPPVVKATPLDASILRAYVAMARRVVPCFSNQLTEYVASAYASLRQEEAKNDTPHSYSTARTLLSILRISEALARLRFSSLVDQSDVDEALRLMQMSKYSLDWDDGKAHVDPISDIYCIIRDMASRARSLDVMYSNARTWVSRKGYTEVQLNECLEEYAALNVWQIRPMTFDIRFLDS